MKTTKIVRLLYRKTHTTFYITRPDPFVRWSAYDSMRDDETTMQLKRTTKRKYFSDPAQFRSYFGAALQAHRLRGPVYVSPFSPKKMKSCKLKPWHLATRAPCMWMRLYITPLPYYLFYPFSIFLFRSCVCRNESKNQKYNSQEDYEERPKKNTNINMSLLLTNHDKRDDQHLHYFLDLFVYGPTCIV